jgi:hypothetical protein
MEFFFGLAEFDLDFSQHFIFLAFIKHQIIVGQNGKLLLQFTFDLVPIALDFCCGSHNSSCIIRVSRNLAGGRCEKFSLCKNQSFFIVKRYTIAGKSYTIHTFQTVNSPCLQPKAET